MVNNWGYTQRYIFKDISANTFVVALFKLEKKKKQP